MQIDLDMTDAVGIKLISEGSEISIYNIYNDCTHSQMLTKFQEHLDAREQENLDLTQHDKTISDIWLGDFNRHHPMWEDKVNDCLFTNQNLEDAGMLIDMLADHDMQMALPQGMLTIRNSAGNLTRLDNIFASSQLMEWIMKCDTRPDNQPPTADHFLIATQMDFPVKSNSMEMARNFRAMDWEELREALSCSSWTCQGSSIVRKN